MPIINFADAFSRAAVAVQAAADAARYLRNTTGDLPVYNLFAVWQTQQAANNASTNAMTLAAADPTSATSALPAFVGAPQTVTDLQTGFTNIHAAATAFNTAFSTWRDAQLTAADLWAIGQSTANGVTSDVLQQTAFIAAAKIQPLRDTPELAALVAAFEAIGATA